MRIALGGGARGRRGQIVVAVCSDSVIQKGREREGGVGGPINWKKRGSSLVRRFRFFFFLSFFLKSSSFNDCKIELVIVAITQ